MDQVQIEALIRHTLTFVGGVLVTLGYMDQGTAMQVTGAIAAIVSIAWSAIEKKNR